MSEGSRAPAEDRSRPGGDRRSDPDADASTGTDRDVCELCGGPVLERHCKIVCLTCGYTRDCSDP